LGRGENKAPHKKGQGEKRKHLRHIREKEERRTHGRVRRLCGGKKGTLSGGEEHLTFKRGKGEKKKCFNEKGFNSGTTTEGTGQKKRTGETRKGGKSGSFEKKGPMVFVGMGDTEKAR